MFIFQNKLCTVHGARRDIITSKWSKGLQNVGECEEVRASDCEETELCMM
jgi:hypothetical protein